MSMREQVAKVRELRQAFRGVFNGENGMPSENGIMVLSKLRQFCYARKSTIKMAQDGHIDPYASIAAAARQEVYMLIISMIDVNDEDLVRMERIAYQEETANE